MTDHSWWGGQRIIEYASPVIQDLHVNYRQISCEQACADACIQMTRVLQLQLDPETRAALQDSIGAPNERGEKNARVLALCESGTVRLCALYQSEPGNADSIRVVTTAFVKSGDIVGIYLGTLRESDKFEQQYGTRPDSNSGSVCSHTQPHTCTAPSARFEHASNQHCNAGSTPPAESSAIASTRMR